MKRATFARGNVKRVRGKLNRTERRRADELEMRKRAGAIHDFAFEAVKLRLADNTFFTADFLVVLPDGLLELEDVKGTAKDGSYIAVESARVRIKVAATLYPYFRFVTVWEAKAGYWNVEEVEV